MKNTTQKLKKSTGFTLAETLITVLILLMVSAVVAGGVPAAANAYQKAVDAANAHVLLSTTVNALRSELSTAWGVSENDSNSELIYYSARTGARTKIYNGNEPKTIMVQDYLMINDDIESQKKEGVNPDRLKHSLVVRSGEKELDQFRVQFESVKVEDDIITFETLGVYRGEERTPLQSMNLSIRILNPDFVIPGSDILKKTS